MPKWLRYEYLFFCISYKSNPGTTWNKHTSNCINGVLSIYYIPLIIKHGCSKPQLRRSQSNVLPTCCFRLRKEASNGCATGGVRKSPLFAQIFSIWINFFFKWTAEGSCVCPINFFSSKSENYLFTYHLSAALLCIEISPFFRSFLRYLH